MNEIHFRHTAMGEWGLSSVHGPSQPQTRHHGEHRPAHVRIGWIRGGGFFSYRNLGGHCRPDGVSRTLGTSRQPEAGEQGHLRVLTSLEHRKGFLGPVALDFAKCQSCPPKSDSHVRALGSVLLKYLGTFCRIIPASQGRVARQSHLGSWCLEEGLPEQSLG